MLIIKSIIYRILRIILLLITTYFIIGNINIALSISFIDAFIATIYYYYFDKLWHIFENHIQKIKLNYKYRKFNKNK